MASDAERPAKLGKQDEAMDAATVLTAAPTFAGLSEALHLSVAPFLVEARGDGGLGDGKRPAAALIEAGGAMDRSSRRRSLALLAVNRRCARWRWRDPCGSWRQQQASSPVAGGT